ncbi:hypothetical protein OJ997_15015 [Solirubrobacter phytolaccae]|uniref:Uncharacterized protein n=1 Tax=Solirubrobacter phytolaccae TaxID=1404360 RepID=A0A9X3NAQ0_9ACTN|nr:hypothetical protein [Solirubrobacter phytolaccae]MDA0181614.1 hypothetical protein [Solirubrobacter phytolaccae]
MYRYVGPDELRALSGTGTAISTHAALVSWLDAADEREPDGTIPATFVVGVDGTLRLAPRSSEHVACVEGADVLAAGELFFDGAEVVGATNQSTGYCPEPASWPVVAEALDALGVSHPGEYTAAFTFRRCDACGTLNVVKDGWFVCGVDLPLT